MRNFLVTVFMILWFTVVGRSQTVDTSSKGWSYSRKKDFSLLTGYNQGKYGFADIGLAINQYGWNRHPFSFDYFLSNEIKLSDKTIIGPKAGVWIAGGIAMGLNMIYYTDFDNS